MVSEVALQKTESHAISLECFIFCFQIMKRKYIIVRDDALFRIAQYLMKRVA